MIWKIFFALGGVYLVLGTLLYLLQDYLIYIPNRDRPNREDWQAMTMQVVKIPTHDQLELLAWYSPVDRKPLTLLYLHGNAGHIGSRASVVLPYIQQGYGVLLLEYRGYGGNAGVPSEEGLYTDARAAVRFLEKQGIHSEQVVVFGESLGSGVAVQLATEYSFAGLILQTPFTSLISAGRYHYPIFPIDWLLRHRFDSLSKISSISVPILILHGDEDKTVPLGQGRRLFEEANLPKTLKVYQGRAHNNVYSEAMVNDVLVFLRALTPKKISAYNGSLPRTA